MDAIQWNIRYLILYKRFISLSAHITFNPGQVSAIVRSCKLTSQLFLYTKTAHIPDWVFFNQFLHNHAHGSGKDLAKLGGIAVATCCHHRCSWRQYVNKAFFIKLGLTAYDFELMVWMTGVRHSHRHSVRMHVIPEFPA